MGTCCVQDEHVGAMCMGDAVQVMHGRMICSSASKLAWSGAVTHMKSAIMVDWKQQMFRFSMGVLIFTQDKVWLAGIA